VRVLGHRQTKEAATDISCLRPPRHISTLPGSALSGSLTSEVSAKPSPEDRIRWHTPKPVLSILAHARPPSRVAVLWQNCHNHPDGSIERLARWAR